jgi:hypothetical protein
MVCRARVTSEVLAVSLTQWSCTIKCHSCMQTELVALRAAPMVHSARLLHPHCNSSPQTGPRAPP